MRQSATVRSQKRVIIPKMVRWQGKRTVRRKPNRKGRFRLRPFLPPLRQYVCFSAAPSANGISVYLCEVDD